LAISSLAFNLTNYNVDEFNFHEISAFKIATASSIPDSIIISNPVISTITKYPTYHSSENLPVQDPFPGFLMLILVSFPIGYVLLHHSGFQKEKNFFVKLPWFLGFGFAVYILYSFTVARFWISSETMLAYLILEYIIFTIYLLKNYKLKFFLTPDSKKTIVLFLIIFIIAGYVSVSYSQVLGYPTGWDSRFHMPMVSLAVENHSIGVEKSYEPINDLPYFTRESMDYRYPLGFHSAAAGITFLTSLLPAVSIISILSYVLFLFLVMFASLVYKYTNSIFFTSLMFMFTFWRPMDTNFWYIGDILLRGWSAGTVPAQAGGVILFVIFIILLEFLEKNKNKRKLFILFFIAMLSLFTTYYSFLLLPIIIAVIGITIYYVKNKRNLILIIGSLAFLYSSVPLYRHQVFELIMGGTSPFLVYSHEKLTNSGLLDIASPVFPFTIFTIIGIFSACYLIRDAKYRYFSLVFLIAALVHFLSFDKNLASDYFFYHKVIRSIGLVLILSISMNLIMMHHLFDKYYKRNSLKFLKPKRITSLKIILIILVVIFLTPTILTWNSLITEPNEIKMRHVPGGNERNLQFWLYENTDKDDLILNDFGLAAEYYMGFKAQPLINSGYQWRTLAHTYSVETKLFEAVHESSKMTLRANEILFHAWDYENIAQILKEYDIDYVYISERKHLQPLGRYPDNYSWQNYTGKARIAMYENHPNLELILAVRM